MVNNKTLIFGHKNPDTDSIMSSMVMANLENQLGNEAIPVRLGKINKETEYVFLRAGRAIYSCQIFKSKESSEKVLHYDKWGSQIGGEPFQAFYND